MRQIPIFLALALMVGVYLRVRHIGAASLWWDEFVTLGRAQLPLGNLWTSLAWQSPSDVSLDSSPPLLHIVIHWILGFARNDVVVKIPSIVFGVSTIAATYFLGKTFFDKKSGLFAAMLCALSLFHINYSREVRPYSLYLFTSVSALIFFQIAITKKRASFWIGYVVASILMLYSSYLASANIFAQCLYFSITTGHDFRKSRDWRSAIQASKPFFYSLIVIIVLYIPWMQGHWNQYKIIYSPSGLKHLDFTFFQSVFKELVAYAYQGAWPYALVNIPFIIVGTFYCIHISRTPQLILLLLWSLFSLLMAMALQTDIGLNVRYLINNFILIIVLTGCGVTYVTSLLHGAKKKYNFTLIGVLITFVISYPSLKELKFYTQKPADNLKQLMHYLAFEKKNVDTILFFRPRHYKMFTEWYLPDAFTFPTAFPDRRYRRFFLLVPPEFDPQLNDAFMTVRQTHVATVIKGAILNRAPLLTNKPLSEHFDTLEFYSDVLSFSNVAPDMQNKALVLYDYSKPGKALYAFEANGKSKYRLDVQAFLRDISVFEPDGRLTIEVGDDINALRRIGAISWKDFTPDPLEPFDRKTIHSDLAQSFEINHNPSQKRLYVRFIIEAKKHMGYLELGGFTLTPLDEKAARPVKDDAFHYFENIAANTKVLRWQGEDALACSDAVYAFSANDARTGTGPWNTESDLIRYQSLHPADKPVFTLYFNDQTPAFSFYDPSLRNPYALAWKDKTLVGTDAELPLRVEGLQLCERLVPNNVLLDGATLPISVGAPLGSELFLNKNGTGLLRLEADFSKPFSRIESQASLMHAMAKRENEDCLTCTGDHDCFITYSFTSNYPLLKAKIISYPRVLTDEKGNNKVTISYSTDGNRYIQCAELKSVGDFTRYDGKRNVINTLEFDHSISKFYVRYELSGMGAEIWGTKDMPQTVEAYLDASQFPGVVVANEPFTITTKSASAETKIFFSKTPFQFYERYQPQ